MLADCASRADELTITYGNVSKASVGTIQRALLQLRSQGGDMFFGEPALDIDDFFALDESGRGMVNILAADRLMASPRLYSTFLLWLLSELFEQLPEVGDPDKPKLVFFFDEAHLLFANAPSALLEKIEQVVRLIRSKGVGIYFITQNPVDIPDTVAAQLGNRVQHALRAFTPNDEKAIRAAADTFRPNPKVDVASAITELKVGEALVSLLQEDGSPSPVERTLIRVPGSRVGPVTPEERALILQTDAIGTRYDQRIDRESAEELIAAKAGEAQAAAAEAKANEEQAKLEAAEAKEAERERVLADREAARAAKEQERVRIAAEREAARRAREAARPSFSDKLVESAARSAASSIGRQVAGRVGGQLLRGLLGGLFRGR
jgi:DNA helicase HerA-like ATPase